MDVVPDMDDLLDEIEDTIKNTNGLNNNAVNISENTKITANIQSTNEIIEHNHTCVGQVIDECNPIKFQNNDQICEKAVNESCEVAVNESCEEAMKESYGEAPTKSYEKAPSELSEETVSESQKETTNVPFEEISNQLSEDQDTEQQLQTTEVSNSDTLHDDHIEDEDNMDYEDTLRYLNSFSISTDLLEKPLINSDSTDAAILNTSTGLCSEPDESSLPDSNRSEVDESIEHRDTMLMCESDCIYDETQDDFDSVGSNNDPIESAAVMTADNLLDDVSDEVEQAIREHFNTSAPLLNDEPYLQEPDYSLIVEADDKDLTAETPTVAVESSLHEDCNINTKTMDEEDVVVMADEQDYDNNVYSTIECQSSPTSEFNEASTSSITETFEDDDSTTAHNVSIATFHDLGEESSSNRLTESELMLGKTKPYWIPDSDCFSCMLCDLRFSFLLRRHHCRACGRVLCAACCSEKAYLQYMADDPKQGPTRVCTPCCTMLTKIEEYEKILAEERSNEETVRVKGVLKVRAASTGEPSDQPSSSETVDTSQGTQRRSVMFRDGTKPGTATQDQEEQEKSTAIKPKKKSRKRQSVQRRIMQLKLEDQLQSLLPTPEASQFLIAGSNDEPERIDVCQAEEILRSLKVLKVFLKKNLLVDIAITEVNDLSVWVVASTGFSIIGQNEVAFCWLREENEYCVPINVLERISQIFVSACEVHADGVQCIEERFPVLHSSSEFSPPLTRHILFFEPTTQDLSFLPIKPENGIRMAFFVHDDELPWVLACPNRVLLRLGLKQSCYPIPIVNIPNRDPVYTSETSRTVLKVFTDFRNWSYRMKRLYGSTVSLHIGGNHTIVKVPKHSKAVISSILSWNRSILAWRCDINTKADSHLVCEEVDGFYTTQILAEGTQRNVTGASFVIFNGSLKSVGQLQLSVIEDGIAIMMQPEKFTAFQENLSSQGFEDFTIEDSAGGKFSFEWVDDDHNISEYSPKSPINNQYIGGLFQYGLSLERALTSVLHATADGQYGIILSQVLNCKEGRLDPDEEPRFFSVAEIIARECSFHLDAFIPLLNNMNMSKIAIRVLATTEVVEYDVSPWPGLEVEHSKYKENIYQLIPTLYSIIEHFRAGFHVEITLSLIVLNFFLAHKGSS